MQEGMTDYQFKVFLEMILMIIEKSDSLEDAQKSIESLLEKAESIEE